LCPEKTDPETSSGWQLGKDGSKTCHPELVSGSNFLGHKISRTTKKEVIVYDYVDWQVLMLAKMAEKRMKGYLRIGYQHCSIYDIIVL